MQCEKRSPLSALYNKMQQEQNEYRAWLLAQPPEEILNHAYEYSSREDILIAFENASLRPAQLRALLESQAPLADIYKDYRDHDTNALDIMAMCIEDRADINLMESTKKELAACLLSDRTIRPRTRGTAAIPRLHEAERGMPR